MSDSERPAGSQIVDIDIAIAAEETAKSPEFAKLIEKARALEKGDDRGAIDIMTKAAVMHLSTIQVDVLLKAIHKASGIGMRALRAGWKTILERAEKEEWEANANARARAKAEAEAQKAREKEERRKRLWVSCSKIAMSATLLEDMEEVAHQLGVVGEGAGIRAIYLTCSSRMLSEAAVRLLQLGAPASGKNLVAEKVFLLMPDGAVIQVSSSSPKALAYFGGEDPDALKGKILYVPEAQILAAQHEHAPENDFAIMLRTLISEGRIVYQTVVTQPNAPAQTITIVKNGPIAAVVTTARDVDPELKTRVLVIDTDESGKQTVAIVKRILSAPEARPDLRPWIALQEWLEVDAPFRVVIPFREAIFAAFEQWHSGFLLGAALRMRRDISSFLTAVESSALLHKAQREVAKDDAIVATIADYRHAYEAFDEGLASSHGKANTKIVATVAAIETLQPEPGVSVKVTLRELAKLLRVASPMTALSRLEEAIDFGAITQDDTLPTGRGKPRHYKVARPSKDIDTSPGFGIFPPPEEVENLYIGGAGSRRQQAGQEGKAFKKKEI